ncbi:MAG: HlyD family secretion protein [Pseudomonadota bacterium]|nr:HlyD family secretion protein [Pseudomonadota bacterium]
MRGTLKILSTGIVVLVAVAAIAFKYWEYITNPWTRDGQVRANVIQVAPRVSGPIVKLPIKDNQFVEAGDLLFEIDPRTYKATLDQASANLDQTRDHLKDLEQQVNGAQAAVDQSGSQIKQAESAVKSAEAELIKAEADYERGTRLVKKGDISKRAFDSAKAAYDVAQADLDKARSALIQAQSARLQAEAELASAKADLGKPGEENAQLRGAKAQLETAQLNLEFTRVKASVDGYVTNLNLRLGSQAVANQPALALVDVNSYWVHGYFRETLVGRIRPGDRAVITLMSYPDAPLAGAVDSIGWGIAQQDGSTGADLLPNISPTFEWIRLAQRVPVRVHLEHVPEGVELRVGTTASVLVKTGMSSGEGERIARPAPAALQ